MVEPRGEKQRKSLLVHHKVRCFITHANPETGEWDLPILTTLVSAFSQEQATFAAATVTSGAGGQIHVGDKISLAD